MKKAALIPLLILSFCSSSATNENEYTVKELRDSFYSFLLDAFFLKTMFFPVASEHFNKAGYMDFHANNARQRGRNLGQPEVLIEYSLVLERHVSSIANIS